MKIYRISQKAKIQDGVISTAVVLAKNAREAQKIYPAELPILKGKKCENDNDFYGICDWADKIEDVEVEYIGKANRNHKKETILCVSKYVLLGY